MQTLVMLKDNLHVLLLIILILMYIVELKLVISFKSIFKKLSIKDVDLLKDYLV